MCCGCEHCAGCWLVLCFWHEWWSCSTHGRGGKAGSFSGWAAVLLLHLLALLLATVVIVVVNVSVVCTIAVADYFKPAVVVA